MILSREGCLSGIGTTLGSWVSGLEMGMEGTGGERISEQNAN